MRTRPIDEGIHSRMVEEERLEKDKPEQQNAEQKLQLMEMMKEYVNNMEKRKAAL